MKKISVLIVDDDKVDRYLLKRELSETGLNISVYEQPDGREALDFFNNYEENRKKLPEEFPPLVVFLDVNMPKVDGFSFLKQYAEIRNKFALKSCVVIMFSSSERSSDRDKAMSYDFVRGYLTKGKFSVEELTAKIQGIADEAKD